MHGLGVFYVHEQHVFTRESFVFDELFVEKVSHRDKFLVLEVVAN
jgi:hypothetical protein